MARVVPHLSKREQQIMDVVYARGRATVTEVWRQIPQPPSRTAVRTILRILEEKGHLKHVQAGRQFVYEPTRPRRAAGLSALQRVLATFFDGSLSTAVAAHLADPREKPSAGELARLRQAVQEAQQKGL